MQAAARILQQRPMLRKQYPPTNISLSLWPAIVTPHFVLFTELSPLSSLIISRTKGNEGGTDGNQREV
jgi:hypothetical protein